MSAPTDDTVIVNPPAPALAVRLAPDSALSDLAVSPFGMPLALQRSDVRVAFAGRTSTEEQQDPRGSMLRQLDRCKAALPPPWVIEPTHFA